MKTTNKIAAAVATIAATVSLIIYNYSPIPSGVHGLYVNDLPTYLSTDSAMNASAKRISSEFNAVYIYDAPGYFTTSTKRAKLSKWFTLLRRGGVKIVSLPYSAKSELTALATYNSQVSDSGKFNGIITEYEQYNAGTEAGYYQLLRDGYAFAVKYKMEAGSYQGWPGPAQTDTIRKYTTRYYVHSYRNYSKYSNPGSDAYGYTAQRLEYEAKSDSALFGPSSSASVTIIYSAENRDPSKTQFGYQYFLTHRADSLHASYMRSYKLLAKPFTKKHIKISDDYLVFASKDYLAARPK